MARPNSAHSWACTTVVSLPLLQVAVQMSAVGSRLFWLVLLPISGLEEGRAYGPCSHAGTCEMTDLYHNMHAMIKATN